MSVWKRLQRVGKKAAKFNFVISFHELNLKCNKGFKPSRLVVVCTRRKRKYATQEQIPKALIKQPDDFAVVWPVPEDVELKSTFYFSSSNNANPNSSSSSKQSSPVNDSARFEDKEWTLQIEDVGDKGHRKRVLAYIPVNFAEYIDLVNILHNRLNLKMKVVSKKVFSATLTFTLTSKLLKTGAPTDDDMISISSIISDYPPRNSTQTSFSDNMTSEERDQFTELTNQITALCEGDASPKTIRSDNSVSLSSSIRGVSSSPVSPPLSSSSINPATSTSKSNGMPKSSTIPEKDERNPFYKDISSVKSPVAITVTQPSSSSSFSGTLPLQKSPSSKKRIKSFLSSSMRTKKRSKEKLEESAQPILSTPALPAPAASSTADKSEVSPSKFPEEALPTAVQPAAPQINKTPPPPHKDTPISSPPAGVPEISPGKVPGPIANSISHNSTPVFSPPNSGQELLEWCQQVTEGYRDVKVTNMTTSFRNGLAFCAIVHHFHPELIDYDSLKPQDVESNNRVAFNTASKLGIPAIINPTDMGSRKLPDRLMVITYLHQLRSHFAKGERQKVHEEDRCISPQKPSNPVESQNNGTNHNVADNNSSSNSSAQPPNKTGPTPHDDESNSASGDKSSSRYVPFMGRKPKQPSLNKFNPDGSFKTPKAADPVRTEEPGKHEMSSHSKNPFLESPPYEEKKTDNPFETLPGASKSMRPNTGPEAGLGLGYRYSLRKPQAPTLNKVNKFVEPDQEETFKDDTYVSHERRELYRQEDLLDNTAAGLEMQLRGAMESGDDPQQEDILLQKWFQLVNQKNRILHRSLELDIVEQERDLEQRSKWLNDELRTIMSIEEMKKTPALKHREELLLKELLEIVNERNKIIHQIDQQEREDDEEESIASATQNAHVAPVSSGPVHTRRHSADANCRIH